MGNSLKCPKCSPAVNHSVFTFSEDLVLKIAEGRRPRPLTKEQLKELDSVGDQEIFNKLRCIDDSHTQAYGLSPSRVQLLIERLEEAVNEIAISQTICESDVVGMCFKNNKECPIQCDDQVTEFDECVENKTRERIKEIVHSKKI